VIVGQVTEIEANVSAIAEASREQAIGFEEINIAVNSWIRRPSRMPPWPRRAQRPAPILLRRQVLFASYFRNSGSS
jgi:hypothetical protein